MCTFESDLLLFFDFFRLRLNESGAATEVQVSDGMCCTRVFAGALLLPTIATLCGNIFFNHIESGVQRAFLVRYLISYSCINIFNIKYYLIIVLLHPVVSHIQY